MNPLELLGFGSIIDFEKEDEGMSDLIDRQAAIDAIMELTVVDEEFYDFNSALIECVNKLKELPPVKHEPKQGKWKKVVTKKEPTCEVWHFECSECGEWEYRADFEHNKYCPNCGIKMQEVEE